MMTLVLVWAVMGLSWNLLSGYSRADLVRACRVLRPRRLHDALAQIDARRLRHGSAFRSPACSAASPGCWSGCRRSACAAIYFALAMLAYPLALLYVFEWLGYQEVTLPMQARVADRVTCSSRTAASTRCSRSRCRSRSMLLTRWIERSRFGLALLAIKQDEVAAEAAGIDTLGLEAARDRRQRRDRGRGRRLLRGRASRGHAARPCSACSSPRRR